jgi:hypothetical protein
MPDAVGKLAAYLIGGGEQEKSLAATAAKITFQLVDSRRRLLLLLLPHKEKKFLLLPQSGLRRRFSLHRNSIAPFDTLWVNILLSICSLFAEQGKEGHYLRNALRLLYTRSFHKLIQRILKRLVCSIRFKIFQKFW